MSKNKISKSKNTTIFDAQILVDSNVFLDFYQGNLETLGVLDELAKLKRQLIFPEQVYKEFQRRRLKIIRTLVETLKKENLHFTSNSLLERVEDVKALTRLRKEYRDLAGTIANHISNMLKDPSSDPVYCKVRDLYEDDSVYKIEVSYEDIEAARNRKSIGEPPFSDGQTICDELIWEGVLSNSNSNLIIVTRDHGYSHFAEVIQAEFEDRVCHKLKIVNRIMEAVAMVGTRVSSELQKAERDLAIVAAQKIITDGLYFASNNNAPTNPYDFYKSATSLLSSQSIFPSLFFNSPKACQGCGTPMLAGSKFCSNCGKQQEQTK